GIDGEAAVAQARHRPRQLCARARGFVGARPRDDLAGAHLQARARGHLRQQRGHLVGELGARNHQLNPFHWGHHDAPMPYSLYIKDSDTRIGLVAEEQLEELIDLLEEEGAEDQDYYIDADVLEFMEQEGADPKLLELLRPHVTDEEGIDVEWREEIEGGGGQNTHPNKKSPPAGRRRGWPRHQPPPHH